MLKKPLLLTVFTLAISVTHAQLSKGNRMVGFTIASAFFNNGSTERSNDLSSSTTDNDHYGISLTPSLGWFVSDDVIIGFAPSVSLSKQKQVGKAANGNTFLSDELSQYGVGVGGFARYYFKGQNQQLRFFGQYNLQGGIAGGKNEGFEYETLGVFVDRYNTKFSGGFSVNTGVNIGASKFLNDHLSIDFYIGYNFSYSKTNPKGTSVREYDDPSLPDQTQNIDFDQKITGNNILLGVGLQGFLAKKKK